MKKAFRFIITVLAVGLLVAVGAYHGMRYLYPMEYEDYVEQYSAEFGVNKMTVYAVIKCESGFDPNAVSSVGAAGLMQLTPDTFAWVQKNLDGSVSYDAQALFDPKINLRYGIYLLKLHKDEFGEDSLVTAAYHAGRGKVNEWLVNPDVSSDGKTLSYIPYEDTRLYVEKVARTIKIYKFLYES